MKHFPLLFLILSVTLFLTPTVSAAINEFGGRTVYVSANYNGRCGSGTSNTISYTVDGVYSYGTRQVPCTVPDGNAYLQNAAFAFAAITANDIVYLNYVLYQIPAPKVAPPSSNFKSISVVGAEQKIVLPNIPINIEETVTYLPAMDKTPNDKTFERRWGVWVIQDSYLNVMKAGAFTELTGSTYNAVIQLVPTQNMYFVTALVMNQSYVYDSTWKVTEKTVATQTQQILVRAPTPTPTPTPTVTATPTTSPTPVITATHTPIIPPPPSSGGNNNIIIMGAAGILITIVIFTVRRN